MKPQEYASRTEYRPPARWYQRLNRLGALVVGLGLAPTDVASLEVLRRVSGKTQRIPVVVTPYHGDDYLVSLAGESQWVKNVRASDGRAVLKRGRRRNVTLVEVDESERPPIIAQYLEGGRERSGEKAGPDQARFYFGLDPDPTLDDIEAIAMHYPVFRVAYGRSVGDSEHS
ncbi:MAG: nitroreductase family deazaflavin-dependent oxidoreductase [Acidimicrobiia bacterium]|jgi:hypothetical protein